MRFLIMLEQTEAGFSVQVPNLAIVTYGEDINASKQAAIEAIRINLATYQEEGQTIPERKPVEHHLDNPEFRDLVFAYVEVPQSKEWVAA